MFKDIGILHPEPFLRVVGLNLNPAFCEIAYIVSATSWRFLGAWLVLGFTIKPERSRLHITGMFHTLSDVQRGEAVPLQQYIDNRDGHLYIGLKSITFAVGWYNIEQGETFSWRSTGGPEEPLNIPPGLYGFVQLQEVLEEASSSPTHTLEVSRVNGLITLTVASGREVLLSDGLLMLLGLDDGLGGVWLDAGVYTGDRPVNFATRQMLWIHLEEINTAENIVDGAPSTLLASIGLGCHAFGDINTVRMECPEYKRLRDGTVGELKVSIRDASGKAISNHNLPIHITLAVSKHEHLRLRGLPRVSRL